jgi:hypothetical protein
MIVPMAYGRNIEGKDGKPRNTVRCFRISEGELRWLKKQAKDAGVSVSDFVRLKALRTMKREAVA